MSIIELIVSLSVNEFTAPDYEQIVDSAVSIQACREESDVNAECKNILERYLEMKEKTGEPYVDIQ